VQAIKKGVRLRGAGLATLLMIHEQENGCICICALALGILRDK
jgi:hypothetical protein